MTRAATAMELRKMQADDLRRDAVSKRMEIAKMRIGIQSRQEKDSAKYRREKRELARILTVLHEKKVPSPSPS